MNKYKAIRTQYNDEWYDSKMEARYAAKLDLLRKVRYPLNEKVVRVERQPKFLLVDRPNKIVYIADFLVEYGDGRIEVVDVKGFLNRVCKMKLKLMKEKYPDVDVKIITTV